jgi:hydroxymethylpyrimidine/phosphomethylpyrimidine kinase
MTIAGVDSSGGAGVAADLKTFQALGVWGTVAVTAVTAQNSLGITATHLIPPGVIAAQIAAVAGDVTVAAAKTGMLGSTAGVEAVAAGLERAGIARLVVDPVLVSKHDERLLATDAVAVLRLLLLPRATVLTPNLPEASALLGQPVGDRTDMPGAASALRALGADTVLLKGGHLPDDQSSDDLLCGPEGSEWLPGPRLPGRHTHGTGCVLSAAIAAYLSRGADPAAACRRGKEFVTAAIRAGGPLGRGIGPVDPDAARAG